MSYSDITGPFRVFFSLGELVFIVLLRDHDRIGMAAKSKMGTRITTFAAALETERKRGL